MVPYEEAPMLRISKLTDYGTVILACLASQADRLWTAAEVAERTRVGLPTVSKLLKKLQRSGLVISTRGSHGGYQLACPPGEISAARILDALEGPVRDHGMQRPAQQLRHRIELPRRTRLAASERRNPARAHGRHSRASRGPGARQHHRAADPAGARIARVVTKASCPATPATSPSKPWSVRSTGTASSRTSKPTPCRPA